MYNQVDIAAIFLLALTSTSLVLSMPVFKDHPKMEKVEEREIFFDPTADTDFTIKVGDMTLFSDSYLEMLYKTSKDTSHKNKYKRTVVKQQSKIWPECTLPYEIDSDFYTENQRRMILRAMVHWEEHTCVRFKERTDERDYIYVHPGAGCSSFVGRTSRQQKVSIGQSCFSFSSAVHELGHAIGFYHEHIRPDRDDYVDIIEENLKQSSGVSSQFEKLLADRVNLLGVGYDYNSIMHYSSGGPFARKPNLETIVAHDPSIPVGLATELSETDILRANLLCGCSNSTNDHPPRLTVVSEEPTSGNNVVPIPPHEFECGEIFDGVESGSFSSPNYGVYPHNTDCEWSIRVREGYQIQLTVDIDMDFVSGCPQDYLEIYKNFDRSGFRLGRWCYQNYNFVTPTSTNIAYIRFHTDGSNQRSGLKGFKIRFEEEDFDECLSGKYCSHGCTNLPGSYECFCPKGFYLSSDNRQCFDINECLLNKGGCDHKCVNKGGYFHCDCSEGFQLLSDGKTCVDSGSNVVDPCVLRSCEYECVVIKGTSLTSMCLCPKGHTLSSDGVSCEDINTEDLKLPSTIQPSTQPPITAKPTTLSTTAKPTTPPTTAKPTTLSTTAKPTTSPTTAKPTTLSTTAKPTTLSTTAKPTTLSTTAKPTTLSTTAKPTTLSTIAKPTTPPTTAKPTTPPTTAKPTTPPTTAKPTTSPTTAKPTTPPITAEPTTQPLTTDAPTTPPLLLPRTGHIQSPNWPETYPVDIDLQWIIECPSPTSQISISLNNEPFWLGGQQFEGCPKDWVIVHAGETRWGSQFGPYCFKIPPPDFEVLSDRALVLFHAGPEHHPTRTGFKLTYVCLI